MFLVPLFIGFYSYLIFLLGLNNSLYVSSILFLTIGLLIIFITFFNFEPNLGGLLKNDYSRFLVGILCVMGFVNLIGVLGPELSFDALWYHLTLPKLYIQMNEIKFLEGGLFYYSVMPKAIEMLYIPSLLFSNELVAKLIHFSFGLLSIFVLYKLSRIFLDKVQSLFVLVVFYSNLVVSWLSITAYIDLGRTFFEVTALYFLIIAIKNKSENDYFKSGVSLGLSISAKVLSFVSLPVYLIILVMSGVKVRNLLTFITMCIVIPLPWFIFAYLNTGNPVYPFFSDIYPILASNNIFSNVKNFVRSPDPISPIYLIVFPLILFVFKKFKKLEKYLLLYAVLTFVIWLFTPQTGGGRFIVPYLPAFSLITVIAVSKLDSKLIKKIFTLVVLVVALVTIIYRVAANFKYIPVIVGLQTKEEFLGRNLNFNFGDIYDEERSISNIVNDKEVYVIGGHNLYYLEFNFLHASYADLNDKIDYILLIDSNIPQEYKNWDEIYSNNKTRAKLYERPKNN